MLNKTIDDLIQQNNNNKTYFFPKGTTLENIKKKKVDINDPKDILIFLGEVNDIEELEKIRCKKILIVENSEEEYIGYDIVSSYCEIFDGKILISESQMQVRKFGETLYQINIYGLKEDANCVSENFLANGQEMAFFKRVNSFPSIKVKNFGKEWYHSIATYY